MRSRLRPRSREARALVSSEPSSPMWMRHGIACGGCTCWSLRRRAPLDEPAFSQFEQRGEDDAEQGNDDDRYEHPGRLEVACVRRYEVTEPGQGRVELGDDDTDQCPADGEPQAGHDERQRGRKVEVEPHPALA